MDINEYKKTVIISDENLDGGSYRLFRNHRHRNRIARNLARMFPEAEVMVCFRDKENWLKSAYKQFVVGYGWTGSFGEYMAFMDPDVLDFNDYVFKLHEHFKKVHVLTFEDLVENPENFVSDICSIVGVAIPPDIDYRKKNVAITDRQVKFIQIISRFLPVKEMYFPISVLIKLLRKDVKFGEWGRKI